MPKTVQIRDIDDDIDAGLQRRAAEERISIPELLRREAHQAGHPTEYEGVAGARQQPSAAGHQQRRLNAQSEKPSIVSCAGPISDPNVLSSSRGDQ